MGKYASFSRVLDLPLMLVNPHLYIFDKLLCQIYIAVSLTPLKIVTNHLSFLTVIHVQYTVQ